MSVMRRGLLIILVSLLSVAVGVAAEKVVGGIGELKIGAPITIVEKAAEGEAIPVLESAEACEEAIEEGTLFEVASGIEGFEFSPQLEGEQRLFHLPSYRVVDSIEVEQVWLYFYKDRLYQMIYDAKEDFDARFKEEFGAPKVSENSEEVEMEDEEGETYIDYAYSIRQEWTTHNPHLQCFSYHNTFPTKQGRVTSYFKFVQRQSYIVSLVKLIGDFNAFSAEDQELYRDQVEEFVEDADWENWSF